MLEITVLGEQRVTVDGAQLETLRAPRPLSLLAYLLVHAGAPQLRQHLAGVFWPESTDAQARTNLRRELHQLRAVIPEPDAHLTSDASSVCWRHDAPCRADVVEFQRAASEVADAQARGDDEGVLAAAERAVEVYRGDLLPALYDDWVGPERERLRRTCVALLERCTTTLVEQGEFRRALSHARRRVELEPLDEPGYRSLMLVQAESGDRAGALRTFHRCTSVLERELGVEPSPETVSLCEQLVTRRTQPAEQLPTLRQTVPLVGRADELELLEARWAEALQRPCMVVVTGEAGIGKSRLVAEFADRLERSGVTVARARCFASRGRLALAPVAEWLRTGSVRAAVEQLDPEWRKEVGRLLPELATTEDRSQPTPSQDAWRRHRFFDALARAVLASAAPTLLLLDDLQWCDQGTLDWLELLLRGSTEVPLLVVGTCRPEELEDNPDLVTTSRLLRAEGVLHELGLGPLSPDDVAELAGTLGGGPLEADAIRQLRAETGGFPLLIVESVRQGSGRSDQVRAVLTGRFAQLSPTASELVGLAAVVGRDFTLELLTAAGKLDEDTLVATIDELWRRRLLREHTPTTYDFSHDLLRDAAYERLSPPQRQLLHRRVANALEQLNPEGRGAVAAQIAEHHERGGQPEPAIDHHVLAAEAATGVFALTDAVRHYRRALELLDDRPAGPTRDRRELALRSALLSPLTALRGYAMPELDATLERTIELAASLGDDVTVVRSRVALWAYLFVRGRVRECLDLTDTFTEATYDHPRQLGQLLLARAGSLASAGRLSEALERFERLETAADDEITLFGFRAKVMARGWRAHARWSFGQADTAAADAAAAIELADVADHTYSRVIAAAYGAVTHHLLGDHERSLELAGSVRRMCEQHGVAYYGEWSRILEGRATGGAAGEALIREGIDRLRGQHSLTRMPFWLSLLAQTLVETGRVEEASRVLNDARAQAERHEDRWWLAELWRLDGALATDPKLHLERACEVASEQSAVALHLRAATDLARYHLHAGRSEAARSVLAPVRSGAEGCGREDLAAADDLLALAAR